MIGKVYPEGDAWIALASEYVSEFKDLEELEERWRDFKELHPTLSVFTESVKELMSATFCDLVDVYERYQNLPSETQEQKQSKAIFLIWFSITIRLELVIKLIRGLSLASSERKWTI